MLDVTVTLHDARDGYVKKLARITITNDGTGTQASGNYQVAEYDRTGMLIQRAHLLGWPRQRESALALLRAALNELAL